LLTENNIVPDAKSTKTELLLRLFDAGILKREEVYPPRENAVKRRPGRPRKYPPKEKKPIEPRYEYLRTLRKHPKKVVYPDPETGEVITYNYKPCSKRNRALPRILP